MQDPESSPFLGTISDYFGKVWNSEFVTDKVEFFNPKVLFHGRFVSNMALTCQPQVPQQKEPADGGCHMIQMAKLLMDDHQAFRANLTLTVAREGGVWGVKDISRVRFRL